MLSDSFLVAPATRPCAAAAAAAHPPPAFTRAGDTLPAVCSAIGRLAGCEMHHALLLPHQRGLQPQQGWLAARCRCYFDAASGTLWMGVAVGAAAAAAAAVGGAGDAAAEAPWSTLEEAVVSARWWCYCCCRSLLPWNPTHGSTSPLLLLLLLQACEGEAMRALLLAFLTSHALLWLQPPALPGQKQQQQLLMPEAMRLLQRLRLLQQLKSTLLPALPELVGVPPAEATTAVPGLCIPQLLLLLQQPEAPRQQQEQLGLKEAAALEAAEAQLRLLLKRCRVLAPEDTPRCLCTLPAPTAATPSAAPTNLLLQVEHLGSGRQQDVVAAALADPTQLGGDDAPNLAPVQPVSAASVAVAAALAPRRAVVAGGMAVGPASMLLSWRQAVAKLAPVLEAAAARVSGTLAAAAAASADAAPDDGTAPASSTASAAVPPEAAQAAAWQTACGDNVHQYSLAACKRAAAVASEAYRRNTPDLLPSGGHAVALQVRCGGAGDGGQQVEWHWHAYRGWWWWCGGDSGVLPAIVILDQYIVPPTFPDAPVPCRLRCGCTGAWRGGRPRPPAPPPCSASWTSTGRRGMCSATPSAS